MPEYEIRPKINENLRLNVSQGVAADHQAVTISTSTGTNEQKWFVYKVAAGESQAILSTINQAYGLNIKGPTTTDTRLCTLLVAGGNARDSLVSFVSAGTNYWYIKLTNYDYYLTCNGSSDGSGVSWQPFTGGDAQTWRFIYTLPDGPKSYAYMEAFFDSCTLCIIRTAASNIKLVNLLQKSLSGGGVYGINGGFFDPAPAVNVLNIAKYEGEYVGPSSAEYDGADNCWCGNGVIYRNPDGSMVFTEGQNVLTDTSLKDVKDLTGVGTWAQGGAGMYLGWSNWIDSAEKFFPYKMAQSRYGRTGFVVDNKTGFAYLIVNKNDSLSYIAFRNAIMTFLNIERNGNTASTRYLGLFLDSGTSTQLRCHTPPKRKCEYWCGWPAL